MADSKSEFLRLKDVDPSFQNRSNNIFDGLSSLEPSNENSSASTEDESAVKNQRTPKRSRNNSRRLPARVPQHVLSPEKWTKYSLESDGSEGFQGLNEHSLNKHAAHSFLADLMKRKSVENSHENSLKCPENVTEGNKPESGNQNIGIESKRADVKVKENEQTSKANSENSEVLDSQDDSKFFFKKPESKKDVTSSTNAAGVWKEGSYVMPEYVVGSARPKGNPQVSKSSGVKSVAGTGVVSLGHLGVKSGDDVEMEEQKMGKVKWKRNFRKRKMDEREDGDCEKNTD